MKPFLAILFLAFALPAAADEKLWQLLKNGGQIVLIRHAVTDPGVGDPEGFRLDECRTQRNLSAAGRQEAVRLGEAFRKRGIPVARELSSPWCRCIDTAKLAFGGSQTERALDNLFGRGDNRDRQLAAFRRLAAEAPQGGNLVLVTHGSTTLAFTGVSPGTTELVIVTPGAAHKVAGRMAVAE